LAERLKYLDIPLSALDESFLEKLEEKEMIELIGKLNNIESRLKEDSYSLSQMLKEIKSIKDELTNIISEFINGVQRQNSEFKKILAEFGVDSFTIGLFIENENKMNNLIKEVKEMLSEYKLLPAIFKLKEFCDTEKQVKKLVYEKFDKKYFVIYERITKYINERNEPLRFFEVYEKILKDININDAIDALLKLDKIGIIKITINRS
jgi:tRNA-dihydrouridine synthase